MNLKDKSIELIDLIDPLVRKVTRKTEPLSIEIKFYDVNSNFHRNIIRVDKNGYRVIPK